MIQRVTEQSWERARQRAATERINVQKLPMEPAYERSHIQVFLVTSSRDDGSLYLVEVFQPEVGDTQVACSCKGGQKGLACKHAAAVLQRMGVFDVRQIEAAA